MGQAHRCTSTRRLKTPSSFWTVCSPFSWGTKLSELGAGRLCGTAPPGVPHSLTNAHPDQSGCRAVNLLTPGVGFDRYISQIDQLAAKGDHEAIERLNREIDVRDRRSERGRSPRAFIGRRSLHSATDPISGVPPVAPATILREPACPGLIGLGSADNDLMRMPCWRLGAHLRVDPEGELTNTPVVAPSCLGGSTCTHCAGSAGRVAFDGGPPAIYQQGIHDSVLIAASLLIFAHATVEPIARRAWLSFRVANGPLVCWGPYRGAWLTGTK